MLDQRTEDILERITDTFFALDRQWRYTYINERRLNVIRRVKGEELTCEGLLERSIWEINPKAVGSVFYQKLHEAMRERKRVEEAKSLENEAKTLQSRLTFRQKNSRDRVKFIRIYPLLL